MAPSLRLVSCHILQGLTAIDLDQRRQCATTADDAGIPRPKKELAIRPQVLTEIPPVDARGVYLIGQRVLWLAVLSPLQWFPTN